MEYKLLRRKWHGDVNTCGTFNFLKNTITKRTTPCRANLCALIVYCSPLVRTQASDDVPPSLQHMDGTMTNTHGQQVRFSVTWCYVFALTQGKQGDLFVNSCSQLPCWASMCLCWVYRFAALLSGYGHCSSRAISYHSYQSWHPNSHGNIPCASYIFRSTSLSKSMVKIKCSPPAAPASPKKCSSVHVWCLLLLSELQRILFHKSDRVLRHGEKNWPHNLILISHRLRAST